MQKNKIFKKKFGKIDLIIDNRKSWIWKYFKKIRIKILKQYSYKFNVYKKQEEIRKGEVLFILGCDRVIPQSVLRKHKNNIVIHESDLPKGRGWSPVTWQVERGKNNIIFTLFEAARKVDAGDYYFKSILSLNGTELIEEIRKKVTDKISEMIVYYLEHYPMNPKKQKGKVTYFRRRQSNDCKFDINKPVKSQFNRLRVVDNERYPAYFCYKNNKYIVKIYKTKNDESR
ncbi:MAG: formyltransferase family protein [Candidatus Firestonebacteria bacterium]